jgi:hypothetical protein
VGWGQLKCGHRLARVALCDDRANAALTLAALRCNAQLELNVVEAHSSAGMTGNLTVRDSAANTSDHGGDSPANGWVAAIINANRSYLQ